MKIVDEQADPSIVVTVDRQLSGKWLAEWVVSFHSSPFVTIRGAVAPSYPTAREAIDQAYAEATVAANDAALADVITRPRIDGFDGFVNRIYGGSTP